MCVYDVTKTEILEKDLEAFKVVLKDLEEEGNYVSRFEPLLRSAQQIGDVQGEKYQTCGSVLSYQLNKETFSSFENTPGIYCYATARDATRSGLPGVLSSKLLKVLIPKGTSIKRGKTFQSDKKYDVVLTEVVIPIQLWRLARTNDAK